MFQMPLEPLEPCRQGNGYPLRFNMEKLLCLRNTMEKMSSKIFTISININCLFSLSYLQLITNNCSQETAKSAWPNVSAY